MAGVRQSVLGFTRDVTAGTRAVGPRRRRRPRRTPRQAAVRVGRQVSRGTRRAAGPWGSPRGRRPSAGGRSIRLGPVAPALRGRATQPGPYSLRQSASPGVDRSPFADAAGALGEVAKGLVPGPPGLVVRYLGPVADDVIEDGDEVAKELFEHLERVYGGDRTKRSEIKGPPAPGREVAGPFEPGVRGLTAKGAVPTVSGTSFLGRTPRAAGLALGSDPGRVAAETVEGFYEMGTGLIGMLGEASKDPSILKQIPRRMWEDFERRYGGSEKAMIARMRKEGIAPEIVDAALLAIGGGGLVGRALTGVARTGQASRTFGSLGSWAERVVGERPGLQLTGGKVRPQETSPNFFRAARQHRRDVKMQRRTATRMSQAHRGREAVRGLVPGGRTLKVRPSRVELVRAGEAREALRLRPAPRNLQDVSRDIVVPRTLRGQQRLEKGEAARVASQANLAHRFDRQTEIGKGYRRELAGLSRKQRAATFHVAQGMIDPTDEARAVSQLKAIRARRVAEREGSGMRAVPRMMSKRNDEVRLIDYLIANSKDIFGGEKGKKLDAFREAAMVRSVRLEQAEARRVGTYGEATAEARRLRAQAEGAGLGVRYPVERLEELDDVIQGATDPAEAAAAKAQQEGILRAYSAEVRRVRDGAPDDPTTGTGLREPAFVTHEKGNVFGRSAFSTGGARAVEGPRRSQMELLRTGRANTSPEALEQSIAKSLKRIHNWELVARQAEVSTVNVTPEMIARAGIFRRREGDADGLFDEGRPPPKSEQELSIDEWRKVLRHHNMDQRDWAFWNPGRMRLRQEQLRALDEADVDDLRDQADVALSDAGGTAMFDKAVEGSLVSATEASGPILRSRGWRLIPKAAHDEIMATTSPSGAFGRGIGKIQGFQSRVMLGLSPSWLQMQVASNAILTLGGTRADALAFVRSPLFWRGIREQDPKLMEAIDRQLGGSVLEAHGQKIRFGASLDQRPTMDRIVTTIDGFSELPVMRQLKRGGTAAGKNLPAPNPINGMFFLDQMQNRYFRRTLLYNSVKREAYERMGRKIGQAERYQRQIANLMRGKDPVEQMREILENPALLERHARQVDDWLGDYTNFTAFERKVLKRSILFYGFLRHSTRLLFYTLPVKHPMILAVSAKLAQLRNEEVRDLLGGDAVPWAFSRVYIDERTGKIATRETPSSKISSVDLARLNPITNAIVDAVQDPKKIAGLMSPAAQILFDQIYSTKAFSGQGFQIEGSAKYVQDLPLLSPQRAQIALGSALSTAYPYRKAMALKAGGRSQSDDSLLWQQEPMRYKTPEARARERARIRRYQETSVVQDLLPLLGLADVKFAKPDTTRADAKRRKQGDSGSSSGGGFPSPGGGGGGGFPAPGGGY